MEENYLREIATHYGDDVTEIANISNGQTLQVYSVQFSSGKNVWLHVRPRINEDNANELSNNYAAIFDDLKSGDVPAPLSTIHAKKFVLDEKGNFFRGTRSVPGAITFSHYSDPAKAFEAAHCVARFSQSMSRLHGRLNASSNGLARYDAFEGSMTTATIMRLLRSTHVISELRQRKSILANVSSRDQKLIFPDLSPHTIVFDEHTGKALMPLGLDAASPGNSFINFGNLVRTCVCAVDENSTAWESIELRPGYYDAVLNGFLEGSGDSMNEEEKKATYAGAAFVTYLRSLEFVTDFLRNDINVPTEYAEQNLNRSLNQFILLEQLESFLLERYGINVYESSNKLL